MKVEAQEGLEAQEIGCHLLKITKLGQKKKQNKTKDPSMSQTKDLFV